METNTCSGTYTRKPSLPYTPGTDVSGVVEAVGDGGPTYRWECAACQVALGLRDLGTAGTAEGLKLALKNGAHIECSFHDID